MKFLLAPGNKRVVHILLLLVFFSAVVITFARPVKDVDLFWHLKTGEWIWQHKALPDKDPFSFTVNPYTYKDYYRTSVILRSYWLSQLIIYGFYSALGFQGIILFRCIVFCLLFLFLYLWMRKKEIPVSFALLFLYPVLVFAAFYSGERPNQITYVMSVLLLFVLDRYRGTKWLFMVPFLMFVWLQMHGGFILGGLIIGAYLLKDVYDFIVRRKRDSYLKKELIVLSASLLVAFLNPPAIHTIFTIFESSGSMLLKTTSENLSPFAYYKIGIYLPAAVIVISLIVNAVFFRRYPFQIKLILLAVFAFSLTAIRYIPFLVFFSVPFAAGRIYLLFKRYFDKKAVVTITSCAVLLVFAFVSVNNYKYTAGRGHLVINKFPDDAVNFIKTAGIRGRMFDYYDWGGYLIFRLFPGKKVFIDPRGLVLSVDIVYNMVMGGSLDRTYGNVPQWKGVLDSYNINFIIVPPYYLTTGRIVLLIKRLVDDPGWKLIFVGNKSPALIFIRDSADNMPVIERFGIPKYYAYLKTINDLNMEVRYTHDYRLYLDLALVNIFYGKYRTGMKDFSAAINRRPSLKRTIIPDIIERIKRDGKVALSERDIYVIRYLL